MCVLGLYVHRFFFAFHLTDFFNNELLKNVLKAIIEPAASLILTLCVMLYFMYVYTLFAYWKFYEHFEEGTKCKNLMQCLRTTID